MSGLDSESDGFGAAVPIERSASRRIRPVRAADAASIIALIDAVYREYDDAVNLAGAEADLLDPLLSYEARGGAMVVLVEDDRTDGSERVVGSHAILPTARGEGTFRRLYLDRSLRGTGAGDALMAWAIDAATAKGWKRIAFWSDSRFARAHRFFGRYGFRRTGRERTMDDGLQPYAEIEFERIDGAIG